MCKSNNVIVGNFNFPNIDYDCHSAKGLDGLEFVKCIQERFLRQYIDGSTGSLA